MSHAAGSGATLMLRGVTVARGAREVVRDVTLDIPPAEVTTLLGPNGAGKSTLVLAVGGVLRPVAGQVLLGGLDLTRFPPEKIRQAGVAVVPEGRRLLPDLTVADNMRVATYSLSSEAASGIAYAVELFPELKERWRVAGPVPVGWRTADGGAGAGDRLAAEDAARGRALAGARSSSSQAARTGARCAGRFWRRRVADRAVRARGAGAGEHRVHPGRWSHPLPRHGH